MNFRKNKIFRRLLRYGYGVLIIGSLGGFWNASQAGGGLSICCPEGDADLDAPQGAPRRLQHNPPVAPGQSAYRIWLSAEENNVWKFPDKIVYVSGRAVNTDTSPTLSDLLEPTQVSLGFMSYPLGPVTQTHGFLFSALNGYQKIKIEGTVYTLPSVSNEPSSRNFYVGIPEHQQAYLFKKVPLQEGMFHVADMDILESYAAQ
jgi:hypothetical protein